MNYWAERMANAQNKITDMSIDKTNSLLAKQFKRCLKQTIADFESTLDKVIAVAVDKAPTPADLYKLDKYWETVSRLNQRLNKLGDTSTDILTNQFINEYEAVYSSIALPSGGFGTPDTAKAKQVINQVWCADGKSWSNRVWKNTEALQQTLNDELVNCIVAGRDSKYLVRQIEEQFGVSYHRAETLVRTEMAHIQTVAAQERYTDYGITEVEVLVDADDSTCDECARLEGVRYNIHGHMPVPAHPNCRCCIVPVVE